MPRSMVEGNDRLRGRLMGLAEQLESRAIPAELERAADTFAAEVREQAPVDSGRLRDSVEVVGAGDSPGIHRFEVQVSGGHETPMVGDVEFGKLGQTPNPFIRRSFRAKLPEVKARIASGLSAFVRHYCRK